METDGIIGKKLLVIFEDGSNHVSKKIGKCTFNSISEIILDGKDVILKSRIIRMEIMEEI